MAADQIVSCAVATFISNSAAETEAIGRRFADELGPGAVVALQGDLGAGKTQFVKGVVAGLGARVAVTSPTFTIVHEYSGGRVPVYHFDFFRIEHRARLTGIGLDDYFFGAGVSLVEWADRFRDLIPPEARWVCFESESAERRRLRVG
jgi:tRNA threonylcarbamoyladenosine biosynthesis protein TsaE